MYFFYFYYCNPYIPPFLKIETTKVSTNYQKDLHACPLSIVEEREFLFIYDDKSRTPGDNFKKMDKSAIKGLVRAIILYFRAIMMEDGAIIDLVRAIIAFKRAIIQNLGRNR